MNITTEKLITALDQWQKLNIVVEFLELDLALSTTKNLSEIRDEWVKAKTLRAKWFSVIKAADEQGFPAPSREEVLDYIKRNL